MKKRTRYELLLFAIVAVIYLGSLMAGRSSSGTDDPGSGSSSASMQTESTVDIKELPPASMASGSGTDKETETAAKTEPSGRNIVPAETKEAVDSGISIAEDGSYTDKDSVALYIATYSHLPGNFIKKNDAKDAGWDSGKGNLDEVCPGMSIGGDRFGNYEGSLPDKKGRKYYECDINYNSKKGYRGAERIIYSNDGLVYYTGDHYKTFELLYGEP
ncbi:MAG: ribonuclease domain-containing protein [Eubacteriales bacterium]|nr:ribonuclease domain-containing protein [Eubacteriales bacterium]